ncbi:hypothetical protein D3C72_1681960 [compost metagenome]
MAVACKILDREISVAVRNWSKPANTMSIKKRLALLDDLLVLFVAGAEFMYPRIPCVLDSVTARLRTPPGDFCTQD